MLLITKYVRDTCASEFKYYNKFKDIMYRPILRRIRGCSWRWLSRLEDFSRINPKNKIQVNQTAMKVQIYAGYLPDTHIPSWSMMWTVCLRKAAATARFGTPDDSSIFS